MSIKKCFKLLIVPAYVHTESEDHTAKKPNFCIANKYFSQSQWLCRRNVAFVSYETNNLPTSDKMLLKMLTNILHQNILHFHNSFYFSALLCCCPDLFETLHGSKSVAKMQRFFVQNAGLRCSRGLKILIRLIPCKCCVHMQN